MFESNTPFTMPVMPANGMNGNGGMWGDNGAWWIVIFVLFFAFGGWGNGAWGGGNGSNASYFTDSALQRGFDNQAVIGKLDRLGDGICSLGYDQLAQMNGINTNILQSSFGLQQAINDNTVSGMQNTNTIQAQLCNMASQNASCCCETQRQIERGFADTNYNLATQSCETRRAITDSTRQIIDFLTQDKIATLTAENQNLKFQASQTAQNAYIAANQEAQTAELIRRINPMPVPSYTVPAPYPYAGYGYGCNNGCGCA